MYNNILGKTWCIDHSALLSLKVMIERAITCGPVDEAARYGLPVAKNGRTAIVTTKGVIVKEAGWLTRYGFAGTTETQTALQAADNDAEVDSILWAMDTPGGSVDGLEEASAIVASIKKPVTVFADGMLASAGVWLAARADRIVASPGALVGSIGVRTVMIDTSEYYKAIGVKVIPVDTGAFKSTGVDGVEITPEQIADTKRIVDGYFSRFKSAVIKGRNLSDDEFAAISDGKLFFSNEAKKLRLIDDVGTMESTLASVLSGNSSGSNRRIRQARLRLLDLQ